MRRRRCGTVTVIRRGERHVRFMRYLADRLSSGDRDLRADLVQEGLIALWILPDDRRLGAEVRDKVERRAMARRMFRYAREGQERRWKPRVAAAGLLQVSP